MLYVALLVILLALAAAAFGFLGLPVTTVTIAKTLFFAVLAPALISLVVGRRSPI
jgi:uncharacterized membrane protein YtjA (UPF0391 family)